MTIEFYKADMDFIEKVYESIEQHEKESGSVDTAIYNLSRAFTYAMFSLADRKNPKRFDRDAAIIIEQMRKAKSDQIEEEMQNSHLMSAKN